MSRRPMARYRWKKEKKKRVPRRAERKTEKISGTSSTSLVIIWNGCRRRNERKSGVMISIMKEKPEWRASIQQWCGVKEEEYRSKYLCGKKWKNEKKNISDEKSWNEAANCLSRRWKKLDMKARRASASGTAYNNISLYETSLRETSIMWRHRYRW